MLALILLYLKTEVTCESLVDDLSHAIILNCFFHFFGLFYYGLKDILLLLNSVFCGMCLATLLLDYDGPHLDC